MTTSIEFSRRNYFLSTSYRLIGKNAEIVILTEYSKC